MKKVLMILSVVLAGAFMLSGSALAGNATLIDGTWNGTYWTVGGSSQADFMNGTSGFFNTFPAVAGVGGSNNAFETFYNGSQGFIDFVPSGASPYATPVYYAAPLNFGQSTPSGTFKYSVYAQAGSNANPPTKPDPQNQLVSWYKGAQSLGTFQNWQDDLVVDFQNQFTSSGTLATNGGIQYITPGTLAASGGAAPTAVGGWIYNSVLNSPADSSFNHKMPTGAVGVWWPDQVLITLTFTDNSTQSFLVESDPSDFASYTDGIVPPGPRFPNNTVLGSYYAGGTFIGFDSTVGIENMVVTADPTNDTGVDDVNQLDATIANFYVGSDSPGTWFPVPEPISMIFFGTGLVAVGGYISRRRMAKKA